MNPEPCYFYVERSVEEGQTVERVWPLCRECGGKWPGAMYWSGAYGAWEVRCNNPVCSEPGGRVIWDGATASDMR